MTIIIDGKQRDNREDHKEEDTTMFEDPDAVRTLAEGPGFKKGIEKDVVASSTASSSAGPVSDPVNQLSRQTPSATIIEVSAVEKWAMEKWKYRESALGIFEPTGAGENVPNNLSIQVELMIFQNKVRQGVPITIIFDRTQTPFTYESILWKQSLGLGVYVEFVAGVLYSKFKHHIRIEFVGGPLDIRVKKIEEGEAILNLLNKYRIIALE